MLFFSSCKQTLSEYIKCAYFLLNALSILYYILHVICSVMTYCKLFILSIALLHHPYSYPNIVQYSRQKLSREAEAKRCCRKNNPFLVKGNYHWYLCFSFTTPIQSLLGALPSKTKNKSFGEWQLKCQKFCKTYLKASFLLLIFFTCTHTEF